MHSSNLPIKLVVFGTFFLFAAISLSGCTSRNSVRTRRESSRPSNNEPVININSATAEELEDLPQLGPALAAKIIDHRNRYGPFRKREHILIVDGVSEARFREFGQFIDTK